MSMPSVRLSVQLLLSARFVLLVLAVVFVAAAFICVEPPASSACPIVIPKPLRALYKESDLVAVARVGESVAVEKENASTLMRTELRITSLLKGENKKKVVALYDYIWEREEASSSRVKAKDEVLLVFLKPYEKGDGYVPADFDRGVKKLSPDDLKVYVSRIEELAVIMRGEKPDEAALTEWFVRCAEEPATRWEGAYELAFNASLPADLELATAATSDTVEANAEEPVVEGVKDNEEKAEGGGGPVEPAAAAGADQNGNNESGNRDKVEIVGLPQVEERIDFAALLTPAQKERLIQALLSAEELEWSEQLLLRLAGNWKDARLVPYSLKHLARMADKPLYNAEDLMRIVAHTLGDGTLIKLVADYSKSASYEDLYNPGADDAEADTEDDGSTAEERAEYKKEVEAMKAAAAEALFQRSGKLRHFLALADQPQKP